MAALLPLRRTAASLHLLFLFILPAATRTSDAASAPPQLQYLDCSTDGNYTAVDAYAASLNSLLAALPTKTVSKNGGFFNGTVGQGAATVYGLALCSVDFSRPDCEDCLTAATSSAGGLVKTCPGSVTVFAIYDQCMLRYSNQNFFGTDETDIKFSTTHDDPKDNSMLAYRESLSLKQALADLSAQAATSPERFAASGITPYAVVQCTWDLPSGKCKACIDALSTNASNFIAKRVDGERKSYSCRVRYNFSSNFTVVPLVAATQQPIAPTPTGLPGSGPTAEPTPEQSLDLTGHPGPSSSANRNSKKAIIAGVVGGGAAVGGITLIAVFIFVSRKNHSIHEHKHVTNNEEVKTNTRKEEDEEVPMAAHAQGEEGHEHLPNVETSTGETAALQVAEGYDVLECILSGNEGPKHLPLQILRNITQDFSNERIIGRGGFGVVYKGEFRQKWTVAVKRIPTSIETIDDKLFRGEVKSLLKIMSHPNVVRFIGFCSTARDEVIESAEESHLTQIRERLLCFEYISNGSLDKHITDELRGLEWKKRFMIIQGICKGLQYLHKKMGIIHMDLKPANIMLDDNMVPKITDFGLARSDGTSIITTGKRFASRGYCAPEYENGGTATFECDMYSLGVIILELVTGRKGFPDKNYNVLRRWRHRLKKSAWHTLSQQIQEVANCMDIAKRCMKKEPETRPAISYIIRILQTSVCSQETMPSSDDDMLGIEPLELRFASNNLQRELELNNDTGNFVAFIVKKESNLQYRTQPDIGIVPPRSKRTVKITLLQALEMTREFMPQDDEFFVLSRKVEAAEGLQDKDITKDKFDNDPSKVVDEVNVKVVYGDIEKQQVDPSNEPSAHYFRNLL